MRDYPDNELIEKEDALSFIMLINKLKSSEDFSHLKDIPSDYLKKLEQNTPEQLLQLISKIIAVFLYRLNIPRKEVETFVDQVKRRDFDMLFDSFEAYDVQKIRRTSIREGKREGKQESILVILNSFCPVPDSVSHRILNETNPKTLKEWLLTAASVNGIEEFCQKAGFTEK